MNIFFGTVIAAASLMAGCGIWKTRAELLKDVVSTHKDLVVALENSRDQEAISRAQAAYDAAYLLYDPAFPQLLINNESAYGAWMRAVRDTPHDYRAIDQAKKALETTIEAIRKDTQNHVSADMAVPPPPGR
jgi:hypothetical protein